MKIRIMSDNPTTGYGQLVSTMDLDKIEDVKLPAPAADGRIVTQNQKGYMTTYNDEISQMWIDYAAKCNMPVFDGGAAYGVATIAALKKGATVIANDSDDKHLFYIAKCQDLTEDDRKRLYLRPGFLPNDIDFPESSIGAIHLCRMMHFFHPDECEKMFEKARYWLVPGGYFFIVIMSPWHYAAASDFAEIYEKKYQEGDPFPGQIGDFTINTGQNFKGSCSTYLHSMDPRVMMRLATKYGFIMKRLQIYGGAKDQDYTGAVMINNK